MKTGGDKLKNRIMRAFRMPPMPKEHIEIVIRPQGGLNITNTGATVIGRAIVEAAGLEPSQTNEDVFCLNYQQNIIIASIPERHNTDKYSRIRRI
ncbi:hypothetical protein HPB49_007706 [Dermacentor silvarum]|uniref:Uncharacterized protein n=1 Tax=Dermacentor silvarum TaxID=543639 RepID=A0ACB8CDY0_DERSI|nr:hypothetical protein HPB49_007706 [Dermacentor silvarum]